VAGVGEPQVVGQIRFKLNRQEPHFREQMATALTPVSELAGGRGIEKDYGVNPQHAVFRGTEAYNVNTGLPRQLGWCAANKRKRVGKPCTIHMELEAPAVRDLSDRADLCGCVDRAALVRRFQNCARIGQTGRSSL